MQSFNYLYEYTKELKCLHYYKNLKALFSLSYRLLLQEIEWEIHLVGSNVLMPMKVLLFFMCYKNDAQGT